MPDPSNFGQCLRAHRLGFRWCEPLQGFLRISAGALPWTLDLSDAESLPVMMPSARKNYVCWWELDVGELLALSPALKALVGAKVSGLKTFLVDDDGYLVVTAKVV